MNPYQLMQTAFEINSHAAIILQQLIEIQSPTGRCTSDRMRIMSEAATAVIAKTSELLPKPGRFKVHEHFNGFRLEDTQTGRDHWLSDGVDCVPDPDNFDHFLPPGGELFCAIWAEQFNSDVGETLEAYFPNEQNA